MASASSSNEQDSKSTAPDGLCDKCGAPASWADESMRNLSWSDGLRHYLTTYNLSRRMWPIGYILSSYYSPLHLEHELPNRNWRDAFEDLLALSSGSQMINPESRKREAEVASQLQYENTQNMITHMNDFLQQDVSIMELVQKLHATAKRKKSADFIRICEDVLPRVKNKMELTVSDGQALIAKLDAGKQLPASGYKQRGQWIASLISSGAVPGWKTKLYDSADGYQVLFENATTDSEGGAQIVTEKELHEQFEEGKPMQIDAPAWSSCNNQYPDINPNNEIDHDDSPLVLPSIRPSVIEQSTTAERVMLGNGTLATKVKLQTKFTDGKEENTETVQDAGKVLKEVEKARLSMRDRKMVVMLAGNTIEKDMLRRSIESLEEFS